MTNTANKIYHGFNLFLDIQGYYLESNIQVIRQIAIGSYAEIFLGSLQTDANKSRRVAIKALNTQLQGEIDPDLEKTLIENILFEAEILRQINHPNIPRYFSAGWGRDKCSTDFYYIIQELVEGQTLARMCYHKPLSIEQVSSFTSQLSNVLEYIHKLKIIHRDIKPNNIIVSPDRSTIKLIDFGTARDLARSSDLITRVGTETYSAPEHLSMTENSVLSPAADVYALAKNVYFMLTGSTPSAFRQKPITAYPVQSKSENLSQTILEVLNRATNNLPENRYQSAEAFMNDLTEAFDTTTIKSRYSNNKGGYQKDIKASFVVHIPEYDPPILKFSRSAWAKICLIAGIIKTSGLWTIRFSRTLYNFTSPKILLAFGSIKNRLARIPFNQYSLKKFGIMLLVLTLTVLIVIAGYKISNQWSFIKNLLNPTKNNNQNNDGSSFIAMTDINLRATASGKAAKIGLVPKSSVVKIVSTNKRGNWCEIIIQQYGREKGNSGSLDRGWVNRIYLTNQ